MATAIYAQISHAGPPMFVPGWANDQDTGLGSVKPSLVQPPLAQFKSVYKEQHDAQQRRCAQSLQQHCYFCPLHTEWPGIRFVNPRLLQPS